MDCAHSLANPLFGPGRVGWAWYIFCALHHKRRTAPDLPRGPESDIWAPAGTSIPESRRPQPSAVPRLPGNCCRPACTALIGRGAGHCGPDHCHGTIRAELEIVNGPPQVPLAEQPQDREARFANATMIRGREPLRTQQASSPSVVSRAECTQFSIFQHSRDQVPQVRRGSTSGSTAGARESVRRTLSRRALRTFSGIPSPIRSACFARVALHKLLSQAQPTPGDPNIEFV